MAYTSDYDDAEDISEQCYGAKEDDDKESDVIYDDERLFEIDDETSSYN